MSLDNSFLDELSFLTANQKLKHDGDKVNGEKIEYYRAIASLEKTWDKRQKKQLQISNLVRKRSVALTTRAFDESELLRAMEEKLSAEQSKELDIKSIKNETKQYEDMLEDLQNKTKSIRKEIQELSDRRREIHNKRDRLIEEINGHSKNLKNSLLNKISHIKFLQWEQTSNTRIQMQGYFCDQEDQPFTIVLPTSIQDATSNSVENADWIWEGIYEAEKRKSN